MKILIVCFLIIICGIDLCNAQQAISTAGGECTGVGGTVSYTIGQVLYTSIINSEGTVSQGIQQPYEILLISSIEDKYGITLVSVHPNPVSNYLKLVLVNYPNGNMTYQLYDVNGNLLEIKKLESVETNIQMDFLTPSVYFLKVTDNSKEVKTFKIIKN
jgi:hypothetical protein